jgi:hypothetical protein
MHIKLEDAPRYFRCRYIATIKIFFDLIGFNHIPFSGIVALVQDFNSCTIMSFIYCRNPSLGLATEARGLARVRAKRKEVRELRQEEARELKQEEA